MDEYTLIAAGYRVDEQAARRTKASVPIILLMVIAIGSLAATLIASLHDRHDLSLIGVAVFFGAAASSIILIPHLARCSSCGKRMVRRALPADDDVRVNGVVETRVFVCEPCKYFFVSDRLGAERTIDADRDAQRRAKRQERTARREEERRRER